MLYATQPPYDKIDAKAEKSIGEQKIEADPSHVSTGSSVRHVFEGRSPEAKGGDDMMGGIKSDFVTIKETFSLSDVPRESLYIGAAGVLPYVATSLSTVYLAWDINHAHETGRAFLFSPETAHELLSTITPIQIGFGAVVSVLTSKRQNFSHPFYHRSSPFSEQSTGVWNMPDMVVITAIADI